MSDLIKREDAIDALNAEFSITGKENARTILNYLDLVKTRIKALPSADRPQEWIPCSERLPERGKDVLVTRDYDGRQDCVKSCRYVEVACCHGEDDNAVWSAFSDEYKMNPSMHKVIAWMPLPTAYKEGADDE